jgi:hypothetical protein
MVWAKRVHGAEGWSSICFMVRSCKWKERERAKAMKRKKKVNGECRGG